MFNPYNPPDRPLEAYEIDQIEATLRDDFANETRARRFAYRWMNRFYIQSLRNGMEHETAMSDATGKFGFWSGAIFGLGAGALLILLVVGTLNWIMGMRDTFGFIGAVVAIGTIVAYVVFGIRAVRRWHQGGKR